MALGVGVNFAQQYTMVMYSQENGRAGRGVEPSISTIYWALLSEKTVASLKMLKLLQSEATMKVPLVHPTVANELHDCDRISCCENCFDRSRVERKSKLWSCEQQSSHQVVILSPNPIGYHVKVL